MPHNKLYNNYCYSLIPNPLPCMHATLNQYNYCHETEDFVLERTLVKTGKLMYLGKIFDVAKINEQ